MKPIIIETGDEEQPLIPMYGRAHAALPPIIPENGDEEQQLV